MVVGFKIGGGVGFVDQWLWWVSRLVVVDFQIGGGEGGFVDRCWWR